MQVKQIINYNSPNEYFGGFLQTIINDTNINASVSREANNFILCIDETDESKIALFNENIAKHLPYSIFLGEIENKTLDTQVVKSDFKSSAYNISPCTKCLEAMSNPSSPSYLDDSIVCTHYNNTTKIYEDFTTFSPHYSKGSSVLITDASKIDELFIMTEDEKKALFSIEKPTLKVTIKDETLKELSGKNYINVKTAYNNRSALVALNAKESEVDYLFFQDNSDLNMVVVQKNKTIIKASRVANVLEPLNEDDTINRFLNISKEAGFTKASIGANLSHTNGISFLVSNEIGVKKVINFQDFNLVSLLDSFQNDSKRKRLLENFTTKFPEIANELNSNKQFDLFETICAILELEERSFTALSDKSFEFRGNGGLKVDMNFSDDGFSYGDLVGSIMSFRLAGVDTHYLAYSIFEAFGDMAINTLNQLKTKFKYSDFVMMGDMFENSVLYSRILSKFQLSNPYFSKSIALDN